MRAIVSCFVLSCVASNPTAADAQAVRLPIAEGVWVKTDTPCDKAFIAHVYATGRFGTVYFYGSGQSMGPANETEQLTRVSKGAGVFTMVNEGPLEVLPRPGGEALVRAYSPSQGPQWTDTVRLCTAATLSPKMRQGLTRIGLMPGGPRR